MTVKTSSIYDRQSVQSASSIVNESPELADVLQKIVHNVAALLEIDNCSIALLDATGTNGVTVTAFHKHNAEPRQNHLGLCEDILGWVASHYEPLVINNVSLDPRFKQLAEFPSGSLACVPLIDKERCIGTLTVSSSTIDAFSARELKVLTIFAGQAVLDVNAIRNASRVKANFLSMITHELRSPLNAINGYLDLALEGIAGELNEQQREFVQRARAGSEHLYTLLEDLLLISRADAAQLHLNCEIINIKDIIDNAVEELELMAADYGLTITVDLAADLPPIYADAIRLQQVLRNLMSNALRSTPPEGSVTVSAHRISKAGQDRAMPSTDEESRQIEIQVRDTGCGIAPEYQQRIFERFYQIPLSVTGRSGGQGLGLAIVKMIVELHGGQMRLESEPGKGSIFSFTLNAL